MNMFLILFLLAGLCYAAAFAQSLLSLKLGRPHGGRAQYAFEILGLLFQTSAIIIRGVQIGNIPITNPYEVIEFIAWLCVLTHLFLVSVCKLSLSAIFVLPLAILLTILPVMCPVFSKYMASYQEIQVLTLISLIHAISALSTYVALFFAAIFAVMGLLQRRNLKTRSNSVIAKDLQPLVALERYMRHSIYFGLLLMALSLVFGVVAAFYRELSAGFIIKYSGGVLVFFCIATLNILAYKNRISSAKLSKFVVALFIFALLMLIPIELKNVIL